MNILWITRMTTRGLLLATSAGLGAPQQVPKTWDDAAVAALDVDAGLKEQRFHRF